MGVGYKSVSNGIEYKIIHHVARSLERARHTLLTTRSLDCSISHSIRLHAKRWLRECSKGRLPHNVQLIQDHEKCLWAEQSLEALRRNHLHPIMDYPPSSQDLNVIEGVWARLREQLHASTPPGIEKRRDFIRRLHGAVRALSISHKDMLADMCNSLQERCREVLRSKCCRIDY